MELTTADTKTKELLREVLLELLQEKRSEFYDLVLEAMEEVGLANALREGRQNDFVSEEEIRYAGLKSGMR
ncbi:MAG TPA: hypothetical protein PLD25_32290 [Chloroflexota bacterium]|nr:hypothetical protein [Chloroflexota bacterium]HUM70746.1 hypothetical protein [Chloroflexota bacterium]